MLEPATKPEINSSPGTHLISSSAPRLPIIPLGLSLGLFLAITYVLCVLFDLWFPDLAMNPAWSPLLPGFTWLTWASFFLGLIEAIAYGWYIALVFVPLFNFFAMRFGTSVRP